MTRTKVFGEHFSISLTWNFSDEQRKVTFEFAESVFRKFSAFSMGFPKLLRTVKTTFLILKNNLHYCATTRLYGFNLH